MKRFYHFLSALILICMLHSNVLTYTIAIADTQEPDVSTAIDLYKSERFQATYDILLTTAGEHPENLELFYYLGRSAFEIQDYTTAIAAFDRILAEQPNNNLARLEIARSFHMLKADAIARRYLNETLENHPKEAEKKYVKDFLVFIGDNKNNDFFSEKPPSLNTSVPSAGNASGPVQIQPEIRAMESSSKQPPPGSMDNEEIIKGISLFKSGQYQEAYDLLLSAVEKAPENLELNFYLGRAAFETQNYEMAVMAFERILIARPGENRVKLEMARSFHMLNSNDTARHYLNEVLESNPPENVRRNIMKFLSFMDKREQEHFFTGSLSVGVDWNNNVWASPGTGRINTIIGDIELTGPSAQKTQDWIYNTILVLNHSYKPPDSKDTWETQAILYSGIYDETSALDLKFAGVVTGYEKALPGKKRLGVSLVANKVVLGQEDYLDSKGIQVSLKKVINRNALLKTTLKHELKRYDDYPQRDADNTSLAGDLTYRLSPFWLRVIGRLENEDARDDENSYTRLAANFSISRELLFEWMATINYNFQFTDYKDDNPLFDDWRQDHQHTAGCSFKKKIWQSDRKNQFMTLDLNFLHTWAFSTIELYDYRKGLMQFFLTYNF